MSVTNHIEKASAVYESDGKNFKIIDASLKRHRKCLDADEEQIKKVQDFAERMERHLRVSEEKVLAFGDLCDRMGESLDKQGEMMKQMEKRLCRCGEQRVPSPQVVETPESESEDLEYHDAPFQTLELVDGNGVPLIMSPHLGPTLPPSDIVNPAPPMPGGLDLPTLVDCRAKEVVVKLIEISDTEDEKENIAPMNEVGVDCPGFDVETDNLCSRMMLIRTIFLFLFRILLRCSLRLLDSFLVRCCRMVQYVPCSLVQVIVLTTRIVVRLSSKNSAIQNLASRVACAQHILQRVESGRSRLQVARAMLEVMEMSQVQTPTLGGDPTVLVPASLIESEVLHLLVTVRDLRCLQITSLVETAIPDEDLMDDLDHGHVEDYDYDGNDVDVE